MNIRSISSTNVNPFYEDMSVNKLVDFALENIDNNIFLDLLSLIATRNIDVINRLFRLFKLRVDDSKHSNYDYIKSLLDNINQSIDRDNLRGVFLELLTLKFLKNKYLLIDSGLDCHIVIDDEPCRKTVDVFALWEFDGFISECKINHKYFEGHDLDTLNQLFFNSEKILSPYIITLASKELIEEKLTELALDDETNVSVHWGYLNVISIDTIYEFFS